MLQWRPKYIRHYEIFMKKYSFVVKESKARPEDEKRTSHLYTLLPRLHTFKNFLSSSHKDSVALSSWIINSYPTAFWSNTGQSCIVLIIMIGSGLTAQVGEPHIPTGLSDPCEQMTTTHHCPLKNRRKVKQAVMLCKKPSECHELKS